MRPRLLLAMLLSAAIPVPGGAMAEKTIISVRFHTEANANDTSSFSTPVTLTYQRRKAYLNRIADISEKHVEKILPIAASDGTWGCVFKLSSQGRLRLETLSGETRGTALVVFLSTKSGRHQVADLLIDRPVTDGIITVPRGITDIEMAALKKQFKIMGQEKEKPAAPPKEKPYRGLDQLPTRMPDPALEPLPKPSSRGRVQEPDLPRLAD